MFIFEETQKFKQLWLWLALFVAAFAVGSILIIEFNKDAVEAKKMPPEAMLMLSIAPVIAILMFTLLRMTTRIDDRGVHVRFRPFHFKPRTFTWDQVERAYVREYKPLKEYGGWGIRYTFKNGKAYNVSGNHGLQLELKNGKKVLVGTQMPAEVETVLKQLRIKG